MWLESRRVLFRSDRKSVVLGKSVKISVDLGGRRIIKKKKKIHQHHHTADMAVIPVNATDTPETDYARYSIPSRFFFFFKQKTAYEISECDWSSDVCSSD